MKTTLEELSEHSMVKHATFTTVRVFSLFVEVICFTDTLFFAAGIWLQSMHFMVYSR